MRSSSRTLAGADATQARGIPIKTMIILGVGWFGAQVFWAFHAGSMPLFLTNFTDSKFTISLVLSLAGVTGLIIPPTVGYLSDRTSTRLGRRKPYIAVGMLGVLLCILSLPQAAAFGIVALLSGLMYVLFRTAETTYLCLLPDITPPEQRSTATGVMNLIGAFGLISCFVLGAAVWDRNPQLVFIIVALVAFGFMLTGTTLIREPRALQEGTPAAAGPLAYLWGLKDEVNVLKFIVA
jgi:Na+/melibiose symporter-like transporter